MAKYKEIGGTPVAFKSGSEEYTYPSGAEGELFYNSSNGQFQFVGLGAGSWASGGTMNTARRRVGAAGTLTAAIAFGGSGDPPVRANAETYNGTAWTEVGDLNTAKEAMGPSSKGSQTAALAAGGNPITTTNELWDGSSWTEVGDINTGREGLGGGGTSTAAFVAGGTTATARVTVSETWDGSSWTEVGNLSAVVDNNTGTGSESAAISVGGSTGSITGVTEEWSFSHPIKTVTTS